MKGMKTIVLLIIAAVLFWSCGGGNTQAGGAKPKAEGEESREEESPPQFEKGFSEAVAGDVTFQWKTGEDELEIYLSAPTEGWVAVGFNPTNMMQNANFIIGYVNDSGVKLRDDYGSWATSHAEDEKNGGTSDFTILGGEEKDGTTVLHFSIPFATGEEFEEEIKPGEENKVILAYGTKDDFTSMHRKKGSITVEF